MMFDESIRLQGDQTKHDVPLDYIYAGVKEFKKNKLTLDSLFLILDQVSQLWMLILQNILQLVFLRRIQ